jgi:hypothetical protein
VLTSLEAAGVSTTVAEDFVTGLPEGTLRYRMLISRDIVQARVNHQPSLFQLILAVSGSSLTMTPNASVFGHWTFDYNLDGDRLTLHERRTTVPDYDGFTSRGHGLAMFTVVPFTRAD